MTPSRGEWVAGSAELWRLPVGTDQGFGEDYAWSSGPGVVFHEADVPAGCAVKGDRSFVTNGGDRLELLAAFGAAVFFEGLVEHLAHSTPAVVWVNPHQMNVPVPWARMGYEAKQETDEDSIVLDDSRQSAQLVEEERVRQCTGRPAPPPIDHLNDVVVILFAERSCDHVRGHGAQRAIGTGGQGPAELTLPVGD